MKKLCFALLLWPLSVLAQDGEFSFSDDPSSVMGSAKMTMPSKSGSVLSLDGSSSLDNNEGAVTYSYKIPLPQWRGLLSSLDITYGSSQGVQNCGQGFALNVPYVERITSKGVPDTNSRLSSTRDGELVAVSGKLLRAKREKSYRLYQQDGDTILGYEGDGKVYVYGLDAGAQERTGDFIARWWLSEIRDPAGSKVSFVYKKFEGQGSYLDKVLFVDGTQNGSVSVSYGFEVAYKELPYRHSSWRSGVDKIENRFVSSVAGYWIGGQMSESAAGSQSLAGARTDNRVFQVNLEYKTTPVDQRPLLSRVVYYGRTDNASDAKPATNFFYSPPCPGPECATTMAVNREYVVPGTSVFTQDSTKWIDMNGDGLADVVTRDDELNWSILINKSFDATDNTITFAEPIKTGFPFRDFDSPANAVIDVNGDRRADLLIQDPLEGKVFAFVNELSPDGFWAKQGTPLLGLPTQASIGDRMQGTWIDINADGKTDFVYYLDGDEVQLHVFVNRSSNKELRFEYLGELKMANRLRVTPSLITWADINADGLPDLVRFISSDEGAQQLVVFLNNGRLGVGAPYLLSLNGYRGLAIPRFVDVNGDGLPDAVTGSESIPLSVYLNNGSNAWARYPGGIDASVMGQVIGFDVGDINGNGSADLLISTVGRKVFVYDPYLGRPTKAPHLLERVVVDTGLEERFSYQSSAKGDQPRADSMPVTMQVVRRYEVSAATFGVDGQYKVQLTKARDIEVKLPSYNFEDNEFSGFKQITTTDYQDLPVPAVPRGQKVVSTYYTSEDGFYLKGQLKLREKYMLSKGTLFAKEVNEFGTRPLFKDTDIRAVFPKMQETWAYEGDKFQKVSTSYCTEMKFPEMVPAKRTMTKFMNDVPVQTTLSFMHIDAGKWFISRPERLVLVDPRGGGQGQTLIDKKFEYNAAICRVAKIQNLTESGSYIVKGLVSYDEFGNPREIIDGRGFKSVMSYDDPGQFSVTKLSKIVDSESSLDQTATYDYSVGGAMASHVDPNGNTFEYGYDGLGRIVSWRSPENTSNSPDYRFEYGWGTLSKPTQVRTFTYGVNKPAVKLLDAALETVAELAPARGGHLLDKFSVKDGLGNVISMASRSLAQSYDILPLPIVPTHVTIQQYDERGRLIRTDAPAPQGKRLVTNKEYLLQDYSLLATTKTSANTIEKLWTDALGRTTKHITGSASPVQLEFVYDAAGRITEITGADPNKRSYVWGLNSKLRSAQSATFGRHEFEYDASDNLISRRVSTASGTPIESRYYIYDGANRVLEERILRKVLASFAEGAEQARVDYRYTYDQPSSDGLQDNLAGHMASLQVFPGAVYHFSYDKNGNKTREALAFYDQAYEMRYSFDYIGRMTQLNYPDKTVYELGYNADDGLLESIKDAIDSIDYGPTNDLTKLVAGPFQEDRSFDEITGVLLGKTLAGNGLDVRRSYDSYDSAGRVMSISGQDNFFDQQNRIFSYDDAGRLQTANTRYLMPKGNWAPLDVKHTYSFDSFGRLLSNELGGLNYSNNGGLNTIQRDQDIWSFDGAGRLTASPGGRKLHWASHDRVACFTGDKGPAYRIEYLPDGSRFTEVRSDSKGTRSRLYLNKYAQYDKEKNQWTKYFYIDKDPIMLKAGSESRIIFRDALGSAELESKKEGANYSVHYPFGALAWESEKADWASSFRYAGTIGASDFEFQQMKSRFYDPQIGQFISPDTFFLNEPRNCAKSPLECGLYSYARGNPLLYVDPSGKFVIQVGLSGKVGSVGQAGATTGVYVNITTTDVQFGTYQSLSGGAVTGAIGRGVVEVAFTGSSDPGVMGGWNKNFSVDGGALIAGAMTVSKGDGPAKTYAIGGGAGVGLAAGYSMSYGWYQEALRVSYSGDVKLGTLLSTIQTLSEGSGRTDFGAGMLGVSPGAVPDRADADFTSTQNSAFDLIPSDN